MATRVTRLPVNRAPMLTERRVRPLPPRRRTGRQLAAGWLAPVYQLRPHPAPPPVPFEPPTAA